jgi:acylphosphatase
VFVSGHVQGVSFRYYTSRQANAWGVTGWVRNLPDGRVEAVFEGAEEHVRHMVDWCRQGPSGAYVVNVEVAHDPYTGEFHSFRVKV